MTRNRIASVRAVRWLFALACLARPANVHADSDGNLSMSVAVEPPNPVPGQLVTVTATFSNISPDARIPVAADFTMDPRTSFGRPLPGACSIATICATNGCDEDEIECLMNVWSGSPGTITLTFTFPTAADRVYVEAGSCRVSSLSPMTCMGGVGSKVWIPDPPPAPQDPRTGCASAGDSAGGLFTTVLALGVLVRRRSRGWRRPQ